MKNNAIKFKGSVLDCSINHELFAESQLSTWLSFTGRGTLIADEAIAIYKAAKEQVEASRTELNGMAEVAKDS
jgi:hypothetical protein